MRQRVPRRQAFTLVEVMIVVTIIGLLAGIAIPNYIHSRATAQMNVCINNLRQIDSAIQRWAIENKKESTAQVTYLDISGFLKNTVVCPSGGHTFDDSYSIQTVSHAPT